MKNTNVLGWGIALVGLLTAVTPSWLLPVCQNLIELANGKMIPMRCHYTAAGEMLLGGVVVVTGIMIAFTANPETYRRMSNLVIAQGMAVVLAPLYFLPTCMNPDMPCNVGTKPALILLGGMLIVLGLIGSRPEKREAAPA